jgi:formamidopyrimidine-DNA glycosylase
MPELPEVETIRRTLLPHLRGALIRSVVVRERRLRKPIARDFEQRVVGRRFGDIERKGKYLLFDVGNQQRLLVHMGMSGTLELRPAGTAREPHDHVVFVLDRKRDLVFNDPRRFGLLLVRRLEELDELRNVGADPLAESWSTDRLRASVRHRHLPIKNLLMDQRAIAGIGNIYANEVLHRAGMRPSRRASRLRENELECLSRAMRSVLEEAVELGGSSISDFRDGNGRPGYFQLKLAVYDRAGEPCLACGATIKRVVLSGRSSFYCPRCQR